MIHPRLWLCSVCVLPLLAACAVGPDYSAPETQVEESWTGEHIQTAADNAPAAAWWQTLQDPVLTQLMEDTATHNLDVRIALANIEQARALRRISIAPFFPQVSGSADATREGFSEATNRNRVNVEQERDSFNASLDAVWELDFFGRIRRSNEAATARLQASEEDRRDILTAALAESAQSYFTARGLQKRIEVLRHNVELLREVEDIAKTQFEAGVTTEFDYTTAVGERQQVESTLPTLEADLAAAIYRISVLAGKDPNHYTALLEESAPLPAPPDIVPVGLRSDLLRRRPDIRRAERELAASNADIGVATAELFPRISLTGSVGTSALVFSDLFTSGGLRHSYGGILSLPIFQGGALMANIDAAKAFNKASLLNYEKAVLIALEEAEVSLTRYGREWQTLERLQSAEAQREEAYRIARLRYEEGQENFLIMLDAERSLVTAQDQTIQSETRILTFLTQLYKALGGGWQAFETENRQAETADNPQTSETQESAQ